MKKKKKKKKSIVLLSKIIASVPYKKTVSKQPTTSEPNPNRFHTASLRLPINFFFLFFHDKKKNLPYRGFPSKNFNRRSALFSPRALSALFQRATSFSFFYDAALR